MLIEMLAVVGALAVVVFVCLAGCVLVAAKWAGWGE